MVTDFFVNMFTYTEVEEGSMAFKGKLQVTSFSLKFTKSCKLVEMISFFHLFWQFIINSNNLLSDQASIKRFLAAWLQGWKRTFHHFGPDWNVSTWIEMKFHKNFYVFQKMCCNNFGDSVKFPSAPPLNLLSGFSVICLDNYWTQNFNLLKENFVFCTLSLIIRIFTNIYNVQQRCYDYWWSHETWSSLQVLQQSIEKCLF